MSKRTIIDEIARIILFECSIFESDAEIKANQDHPQVQKAYRAADRIVKLPGATLYLAYEAGFAAAVEQRRKEDEEYESYPARAAKAMQKLKDEGLY